MVIEVEGDDKAQVAAKANQAGLAVQALSRWRKWFRREEGIYCRLPILLHRHGEAGRMAAGERYGNRFAEWRHGPAAMMQANRVSPSGSARR